MFGDGFSDIVDAPAQASQPSSDGLTFFLDLLLRSRQALLTLFLSGFEVWSSVNNFAQGLEHGIFNDFAGNRNEIAGEAVFRTSASVTFVIGPVTLAAGLPIEGGATPGAVDEAREEVIASDAAWVTRIIFITGTVALSGGPEDALDSIKYGWVNDGRAVVFDNQVAVFEYAGVEFIGEECLVG